MIALPQDRMDQLLKRFSMIESQMANNPDSETYVKLASEYSELQDVVGKIRELTDARKEAVDLAAMRDDASTDAEMRALALEELPEVLALLKEAELALKGAGRVLLRYSGTEPKIRLLIEGRDQTAIETFADGIAARILKEIGA